LRNTVVPLGQVARSLVKATIVKGSQVRKLTCGEHKAGQGDTLFTPPA
jgi:hypothetical protein